MSKYYIYKMEVIDNDEFYGSYIGQHKIGKKEPSADGYKGSGSKWKKQILANNIPVKKTILRLCEDIDESNYWEQYYIEQALNAGEYLWNVMKGGGNHESERIYTEEELRAHNRQRTKRWYEANKERHLEKNKEYRKNNRERVNEQNRKRVNRNKEFYTEYYKQYNEKNKDKLSAQKKKYYQEHKEYLQERNRKYWEQYYITHAEEKKAKSKDYYATHKGKRNEYYSRLCLYDGKVLTFRALILRFIRNHIENPTQVAKQYLIEKEKEYGLQYY